MSAPPLARERHDPFAALRVANYRRFGFGFLMGSMGLQILNTVVLWEIWIRTKDPFMLGFAGLCRALPVVLLALIAGHVADVRDRRTIVALTQLAFAVVALAFAALSFAGGSVWWIFALLVVSACVRAFNGPARGSFLPLIVEDRIFHNVVAYQSGIFQAAAMGGPLLAGVLIAWLGPSQQLWAIYVIAAIGCLVFSASVAATKPRAAPRAKGRLTVHALLEGVHHMWRERPVFGAILLDLLAVLFGGATALLPVFATDILHAGPSAPIVLGWLKAAPFLGALVMAVWLAFRPSFERTGPVLLWSVAAYALAIIVFGLSTNVWLSLAALAISGAVDNVSVVIRHVLVQMRTPDALRGRVSAVNSMFIECSNELGGFESGVVARLFGPVVSVVSGGVGTLVVVGGIAWGVPGLRRLGRVRSLEEPQMGPD
jgi:MFS family permease